MIDNILYTVFTKCYLKVGKGRYLLSVTRQLCNCEGREKKQWGEEKEIRTETQQI